jgi:hypothetical protein
MKFSRLILVVCALALLFMGCGKEGTQAFRLGVVADTIESYPSGGGLFIGYISGFSGIQEPVAISVEGDARLHPKLTRTSLSGTDSVFELIVKPEAKLVLGDYPIKITATSGDDSEEIELVVSLVDNGANREDALVKFDQFFQWLSQEKPEVAQEIQSDFFLYKTYLILIVEHYTVLTENYEIRFCYHVMIPPYDWSKIRIRERNVIEPELAAERSTDGTIHEIAVSDYPTFYGY